MRKNVVVSYVEGLFGQITAGETYTKILSYFYPEFVSALVLYSLLYLLDARFIAGLKSTSMYATLGISNTFLNFVVKSAEAVALSITVLCGQLNGSDQKHEVGRAFVEAFWLIVFVGACFAAFLFFGAYYIYLFLGVPEKMIFLGTPFLRVRAVGFFFMFIYLACVSLMRAVKDTRTPMVIFVIGAALFIFFDYVLIFGSFGMPVLGLIGSAWASVIQYGSMVVLALACILLGSYKKKYSIDLFADIFRGEYFLRIVSLSWPMVIDKATIALAYIWLGKMIAPMGKYALASFTVIKDIERFAFLPAVAMAQIITFLVSNDFGKKNWQGIAANIKKVVFLSSIMVFALLLVFSICPGTFIRIFDQKGMFTAFSAHIFPFLSLFVTFDLLQLVLAAALRGAGDVRLVMWTRVLVCGGFLCPLTYYVSALAPITDPMLKFLIIYATFYVGSGIMSMIYIHQFRTGKWSKRVEQKSEPL